MKYGLQNCSVVPGVRLGFSLVFNIVELYTKIK